LRKICFELADILHMAPLSSSLTGTRARTAPAGRPLLGASLRLSLVWLLMAGTALAQARDVSADSGTDTDSDTTLSDPSSPSAGPIGSPGAISDAASANVPATPSQTAGSANRAGDITGSIDDGTTVDSGLLRDQDLIRSNLREGSVDGLKSALDADDDVTGIPLGTFTLKPSIGQTINSETTRSGDRRERRTYAETGLKGTLTSDWSRHQLEITGEGYWQRNLSGTGETKPRASIDGQFRLDISHDTIATFRAGYSFDREDATDPNAINGAETQAGVNTYTLGAGIEHDFGILRGSAKVDVDRLTYSDVDLSSGTTLSQRDRNRDVGTVTTRVGYELSPALVPFLEASIGRGAYDLRRDSLGFARSYKTYAGRAGVETDFGEKLKGEIALGYGTYRFDDARLKDLNGATIDGLVNWSPQRGTDVATGLSTALEPSTTSGESGALAYTLSNRITHELRSALVARLANSLTFRNYPSGSTSADARIWLAGAGLTYEINRYLALTGDVSYERTTPERGDATSIARIGVGLTLRR
jgi:hypothetical protein